MGPSRRRRLRRDLALPQDGVEAVLQGLVQSGKVVEGGFRPGGIHREWCDNEALRAIRRRSLARLRKEVEPVEQKTLARLFTRWQGVVQPRRGLDALLDVIENLQGAPLPASILETEILPARLLGYKAADLDTLIAAGEVAWVGMDPIGERDGRIGLYLAEKISALWSIASQQPVSRLSRNDDGTIAASPAEATRETEIVAYLKRHGASFFQDLHDGVGGGYPGETLEALWSLGLEGVVDQRWDGRAAYLL